MTKKFFLLLLIFSIGVAFRFYRIGEVPVGFHRDEAFLGYNAYSILKTAKDMNGNFLPLHLESFLYSPAGYFYLSIPFIKLFDLNALSVRFASALFGSLTILTTYFLAKQLFHPRGVPQAQHHLGGVETLALMSSFFLAISPWHINLSRTATENTVVVFFIALGILLFLLWTRKANLYLLLASFFCFGLTLLVYQSPRAFLPLLIPLLLLLFLKDKKDRKRLLVAIALFFVTIILPLMLVLSSKNLTLRIRTVSIFATRETQLTIDEQIREDGVSNVSPTIARLFHNKITGYTTQFLKNYLEHFSLNFLFTEKALPTRYKIPNVGLLYAFELPLLILGAWTLMKERKKEGIFLLAWILLVPVGSALTFDDVPNLQRTLIVFPALPIILASGLHEFFVFLKKYKKIFPVTFTLLIVIILYHIGLYLHQYYVHQLVHRPWFRHEGYERLVKNVNMLLPKYEKAVITDRESAPTIFFLFYGKYNPSAFQNETRGTTMRDFDRINFGKYEFSQKECPLIEFEDVNKKTGEVRIVTDGEKNILYVNYGTCKIPKTAAKLIDSIERKDATMVFQILELAD